MPRVQDLVSIGMNAREARHIGFDVAIALTATGTTQGAGYAITANWNQFTVVTPTNNAATMPTAISSAFGQYVVRNDDSADDLILFPAVGDSFNAQAANASITIPASCMAVLCRVADTQWLAALTLTQASDLVAIEALNTNGLLARTTTNTWISRSVVGPTAGITVSNGDGINGNPTLALSNDLGAIEALNTNGLLARTTTDSWISRSVVGTAHQVIVSNGDGINGNPTLATPQDIDTTSSPTFGGATIANLLLTTGSLSTSSGALSLGNGATTELTFNSTTQWTGPTAASWTPTYTATTGTYSSVTTHFANYFQFGKWIFVSISATGTTSDTTANINFTVPVTAATTSDFQGFGAVVYDAGPNLAGFGILQSASSTVNLYLPSSANWTAGSGRTFRCNFIYQSA